jgi:hypothetical protein
MVASHLMGLLLPALTLIDTTETRANVQLELARLGAALAVFRSEHGAYPAKLDELISTVLDKLPSDDYGNQTFFYQRTDDGYLLYSAGANLSDDQGSNERYTIFEGIRLDTLEESAAVPPRDKIPQSSDDISIRIPRGPLKAPASKPLPAH